MSPCLPGPCRFVTVPVVEHLHWSLAAVCNLDGIEKHCLWKLKTEVVAAGEGVVTEMSSSSSSSSSPPSEPPPPCVFFADSLNMHSASEVATNLSGWLLHEWRAKRVRLLKARAVAASAPGTASRVGQSSERAAGRVAAATAPVTAAAAVMEEAVSACVEAVLEAGLPLFMPKVPKQHNCWDCGVFTIR